MKIKNLIIASILLTLGQSSLSAIYIKKYCEKEYQAYCQKQKEAPYLCLRNRKEVWSEGCRKAFALYEVEMADYWGPCVTDPKNVCLNLEPGTGVIGTCLKENLEKLSPRCIEHIKKPWVAKYRDMNLDFEIPCEKAMLKHCKDVKRGDKRLIKCMLANFENVKNDLCRRMLKPGHKKK